MTIYTVAAVKLDSLYRPPDAAQPWHEGPKWPEWVDPTDHKVNYFVPNFGVDRDIGSSLKHTEDAEKALGHVMEASFDPPKEPKRDYFVPHFGEDAEITSTKKNIAAAEKALGHVYDTSGPADPPPRNYFVPHFGEDHEISTTKKIIA